jgi:hypothetical protein
LEFGIVSWACDIDTACSLIDRQQQARLGKSMRAAEAVAAEKMILNDNGGRRLGDDRRLFSYNGHIPERRSGKERRTGLDRRQQPRFA